LTALFGARIDELRAQHIQALVDASVSEASDLDFKAVLYASPDKAKQEKNKRELCKDIAGMRNAVGGVIILGVSDRDAVAAGTPEVMFSDAEERRMQLVVASGTAPHAEFDIHRVPGSRDGHGFYLLLAPPSPSRPHAVVERESLRYPRRDGTLTRWLTEAEVADLYRDRFRGQADQRERVARIGSEARDQIALDAPWIIVAAVPNHPGSLPISFAAQREIEQWMRAEHASVDYVDGFILPPAVAIAGVGVERYTISTHFDSTTRASSCYMEFHVDGAATAARRLNSSRGDATVLASDLVMHTAKCLRLIGAHATRTGSFGDAVVHLQLIGGDMRLGYIRDGTVDHYNAGRALTQVHSRHTLPLSSLVDRAEDLFAAVRIMLGDVFNGFGRAEVPNITPDGALRLQYFHEPAIADWAVSVDLTTTDELVAE
jgi:hypothetical protein